MCSKNKILFFLAKLNRMLFVSEIIIKFLDISVFLFIKLFKMILQFVKVSKVCPDLDIINIENLLRSFLIKPLTAELFKLSKK